MPCAKSQQSHLTVAWMHDLHVIGRRSFLSFIEMNLVDRHSHSESGHNLHKMVLLVSFYWIEMGQMRGNQNRVYFELHRVQWNTIFPLEVEHLNMFDFCVCVLQLYSILAIRENLSSCE